MDGIVSHVAWFTFVLVLAFLIFTNYKGFVAIMSQGGQTYSSAVKTLQGR